MSVCIDIVVTESTPAVKDSYGKEKTPAEYVAEEFKIQAATRELAIAKAQKILEIV